MRSSSGTSRRHVLALLVGTLLGMLVALMGAGPVQAHAVLVGSTPEDGATLDRTPTDLVLRFDSTVEVSTAQVTLVDALGHDIAHGTVRALEDPGASSSLALRVELPPLARGRYLVRWQTFTSSDLHRVSGSLTFGVGVDAVAAASSEPGDRGLGAPGETLARAWVLLGLALLLGSTAVSLTLTGSAPVDARARRRLARLAAAGGAVGVLAATYWGIGLVAVARTAPPAEFVRPWTGVLVGLVVAVVLARRRARVDPAPSRDGLALLVVLASAVSIACVAALGHGSTGRPDGIPGSVIAALHVTATLCWAGGLVAVTGAAVPELRSGRSPWASRLLRRFTRIAVPALAVSVVTGLLLTSSVIPALRGLTDTDYGRGLLVKVGLVAAAAGLGALTGVLARRRGDGGWVLTRLVAEGALLVGVVVMAAALAGGQPPSDARWLPSPTEPVTSGTISGEADDLEVSLSLGPGRPGANFVTIGVFDTRRPAPARIDSVSVAIGATLPLTAPAQGAGRWVLPTRAIDVSGRWPVTVTVRRAGLPDARATFDWQVAPRPGTELGGTAMCGSTVVLAWLVLLGAAALALGWHLLRRRARRHAPAPAQVPPEQAVARVPALAAVTSRSSEDRP
jgi:putative copper export protein/methionine-rich copper-binding protein CopC